MNVWILVALSLGQAAPPAPTEFSKQSRGLFEKLVDLKVEKGLLTLVPAVDEGGARAILQSAQSSFPGISHFTYSTGSQSFSRSGGGSGGSVNIQFQGGKAQGGFDFQLSSPNGAETILLRQTAPGELAFEVQSGKASVSYTQEKGKCRLKIRAGAESGVFTGASFEAVVQAEPLLARKYLVGFFELYFDKMPVLDFGAAPPGKTILHLRDGSCLVGSLALEALEIETTYGKLRIPRDDLRQIFFPGSEEYQQAGGGAESVPGRVSEPVVVARRFSPRGRIRETSFDMTISGGSLHVDVADIAHVAFGPPLDEASKDAPAPAAEAAEAGAVEAGAPKE
jgi:hypothetical protein